MGVACQTEESTKRAFLIDEGTPVNVRLLVAVTNTCTQFFLPSKSNSKMS